MPGDDLLFFCHNVGFAMNVLLAVSSCTFSQHACCHMYVLDIPNSQTWTCCSLWDSPDLQGTASMLQPALLAVALARRDRCPGLDHLGSAHLHGWCCVCHIQLLPTVQQPEELVSTCHCQHVLYFTARSILHSVAILPVEFALSPAARSSIHKVWNQPQFLCLLI